MSREKGICFVTIISLLFFAAFILSPHFTTGSSQIHIINAADGGQPPPPPIPWTVEPAPQTGSVSIADGGQPPPPPSPKPWPSSQSLAA